MTNTQITCTVLVSGILIIIIVYLRVINKSIIEKDIQINQTVIKSHTRSNKKRHMQSLNFLIDRLALLSYPLQHVIKQGTFYLIQRELFIKTSIAGASGIFEILTMDTKKEPGISSFEEWGRIEQNKAVVWYEISLKFGLGNTAGDADYSVKIPPQLANAELVVSQKGRMLFRSTVDKLHNKTQGYQLFIDDEDISSELHFPAGVSMPEMFNGKKPFIYLSFLSLETQKV